MGRRRGAAVAAEGLSYYNHHGLCILIGLGLFVIDLQIHIHPDVFNRVAPVQFIEVAGFCTENPADQLSRT